MAMYTLSEAAKATGLNRTTLFRAIRAGKISASQDEHKQWALDPAEVHRVYPPVAAGDAPGGASQQDAHVDAMVADLRAKLDDMRAQRDDIRAQRDDVRADRDAWREQAQRLTSALPKPVPVPQPVKKPRQTFWQWLCA